MPKNNFLQEHWLIWHIRSGFLFDGRQVLCIPCTSTLPIFTKKQNAHMPKVKWNWYHSRSHAHTHTHTPTTRSTAQRHYIHSYLKYEMEHEMELRRTHTSVTGLLSLRISIFVIGFRKSCTFMIPFHVNLWKSKFIDWSMAGDRLRGKI